MLTSEKKTILGIDPGFAITGYGLIACQHPHTKLVSCGAITSSSREPFDQRLYKIYCQLAKIIKKYRPDEVAIEELFFAKNTKTALKVGQARGVVILVACQHKLPIREFTPLQVKQAMTGYGFATKSQVEKMVQLMLNIKSIPRPDDIADALAVALCSAQTKQFHEKTNH